MQQQSLIFSAIIFVALLIIVFVTVQRYFNTQTTTPPAQDLPTEIPSTAEAVPAAEPVFPTLTAQEFLRMRDALIIDMRSFDAFTEAHIRGARFFADTDLRVATTQTIVLVIDETITTDALLSLRDTLSQEHTIYTYANGLRSYQELGGVIIRQNSAENFDNLAKVSFVEPRDLSARNTDEGQKDLFILDVRRAGNYDKKHIKNAINIPLDELEMRYKELLATTKEIYVYGVDDDQSFQAGAHLFDLGILDAKTLKGGLNAWQEFEYPIIEAK